MIRYDLPVELQERVEVQDGYDEGDNWRTVETRHASIVAVKGGEQTEADAVHGRTTYRITTRLGGAAVTSAHRYRHAGRIFNIESVTADFRRPGIQIAMAVEER